MTPTDSGGTTPTPTDSGGTTATEVSEDFTPVDPTIDRNIGTIPTNIALNGYNPNSSSIISNALFTHTYYAFYDGSYEMEAVDTVDYSDATLQITFKEGYTYHNGDPLTAENFWLSRALLHNLNPEFSTWEEEPTLVDDYTFEGTLKTPSSKSLTMARYAQGLASPAEVFMPVLESLRSAGSQEERDQIYNDTLKSVKFGLQEAQENGYTNGPYQIKEFNEQEIVLEKYEDHPRADDITIPEWRYKFYGGQAAKQQAIKNGDIDYGSNLSESLQTATPRDVQTLDKTGLPFGFHLGFNYKNKHLGRRNVRRAIVSALPIDQIQNNFGRGIAVDHQTSMPNPLTQKYAGDIAEDLIQYPRQKDTERATQYMQRAGYEKNGSGNWVGPDGDTVDLELPTINGWSLMAKTTQEALDSFGMDVGTTIAGWNTTMQRVREEYDYDLTLFRHGCWGRTPHPACFYRHDKHINLNIGTDEDIGQARENGNNAAPKTGKPIRATIPNEIGAEEVSGSGRELDLPDLADQIETASGDSELAEKTKLGARYVNYDLPVAVLFTDVQAPWGDTASFNFPQRGSKAYKTSAPMRRLIMTGNADAVPEE
jgi:peptide/nickel transport system substrate-binding protein